MATENLLNLEKNAKMSPSKDELLASYSKQNFWEFWENWKNAAIRLSIECPILLIFMNSSQIFSEGLLVIAINKVQRFSHI